MRIKSLDGLRRGFNAISFDYEEEESDRPTYKSKENWYSIEMKSENPLSKPDFIEKG